MAVARNTLKLPKTGAGSKRNGLRAVQADSMSEDELDMVIRGTPKKPGLARQFGWLVYHTRNSIGSDPGFPDLVLARGGIIIYAELKSQKGSLSADQRLWRDELQAGGQTWYLWRPADWFDGTIEAILR